jgi:hypothetical protein
MAQTVKKAGMKRHRAVAADSKRSSKAKQAEVARILAEQDAEYQRLLQRMDSMLDDIKQRTRFIAERYGYDLS